ncbi:MAG: RimK family alpha-L-glutamate ligase [Gammaproteobacteria bacterium]|nr:RimK family alpha-L-glutamate ligase [Gammaproteobacteria bacterium]
MNEQNHIAIVTDDPGWHGKRLTESLQTRGFHATVVSLSNCAYHLDNSGSVLEIPGFFPCLPDGVFVRGIPGGTLEQVVFYLNVLHGLEQSGVKVYNNGRVIERTVDKALTSLILQQAGLPVPPTWILADREHALQVARQQLQSGHALVFKPLFGSQGEGLQLVRDADALHTVNDNQGIYYFQHFLTTGNSGHFDWRVFVIDGKAIAAARRSGTDWLNNVAQGGRCEAAFLDKNLSSLAERSVQLLDMDYGGVDIISDAEGRLYVLEVNSVPAWKGLQQVCEVSLADLLIEDFIGKISNKNSVRQAAV